MSCTSIFSSGWFHKRQDETIKENSNQDTVEPTWGPAKCCCACEPLPGYEETQGVKEYVPPSDDIMKLSQSDESIANTISDKIGSLNDKLRQISLSMWNNPETGWKERKTHDLFVNYLQSQKGWKITPHAYGFETAFKAEFIHRPNVCSIKTEDLPTIGFQSELDALPGIGHACGHNLIAIAGLGASLGLSEVLQKYDIPGRIILLGTPAEEMEGGKIKLLEKGAYKDMDACLMVHPASMDSVGPMLAKADLLVRFTGHGAHAGASPWEGINAQDAAVLSYMNISALRQQIKPNHRIHGIIQGDKSFASNVIPAACNLMFNVRAPKAEECDTLVKRVENCFKGAAIATGCKADIRIADPYKDVANNSNLAETFRAISEKRFERQVSHQPFFASTDFGDITYALPSLHAQYAIPLKNPDTDKNHTPGFANAAKTLEAHELTLQVAITIAIVGAKIVSDNAFREQTWNQWKKWRKGVQ